MNKSISILFAVVLALSVSVCGKKEQSMNSFITIFEIPAADIERAIGFYQAILDIKIEKVDMGGQQMGILPYEGQMVFGVLARGEGYRPSADGVTVYLNGGNDLNVVLDRVDKNGGQIIVTKTPMPDESGFFALFLDTEGNRLGLHSPG